MQTYNMGKFRPRHRKEFDPTALYEYFDVVFYQGSSYININEDLVDGASCIGILPVGQPESENYWYLYASKGDKGDSAEAYKRFINVGSDGIWDFSQSDKCILADDAASISISNVYDGCCGMIITNNRDFTLPQGSQKSLDFNYVIARDNQYYMYTFVYMGGDIPKYIWNRTVIVDE